APGEPLRDAVPEPDPRLTVLPAQVDDLVIEQAGEIDQTCLRPVDQAADRVNLSDQLLDRLEQAWCDRASLDVFGELGAAQGHSGLTRGLLDLGPDFPESPEQLLDRRPQTRDQGVGFIDREEPGERLCVAHCRVSPTTILTAARRASKPAGDGAQGAVCGASGFRRNRTRSTPGRRA